MLRTIVRFLVLGFAVLLTSMLLPGISVDNFVTAVLAGVVLVLLNMTVRPVLVILTLPATILSMGLFLLVINAALITLASSIVPGFHVDGFWWALLFSFVLSIVSSVLGLEKN